MFSLPILIVPLAGKFEESATDMLVLAAVRLLAVVVDTVSKSDALVSVNDVSELLMPPLSLSVV